MFTQLPGTDLGIRVDYAAGMDFQPVLPQKCWSDARLDVLVSLSDASRAVKATNSELRQGLDFICNQLSAAACAARSTSTELRQMSQSLGTDIVGDLMDAIDSMHVVSSARAVEEVLDRLQSATHAVNRSNTGLKSLLGLKELGRLADAANMICDVSREARYRLKIHRAEFKDIPCAQDSPRSDIQPSRANRGHARRMVYRLAACLCLATMQFAFGTWSKAVELTKRTLSQVSYHQISHAWNLSSNISRSLLMGDWLLLITHQWRYIAQQTSRAYLWRNNVRYFVSHLALDQDDQFLQVIFLLWWKVVKALRREIHVAANLLLRDKREQLDGLSEIVLRSTTKVSDHATLRFCINHWRTQVLEGAVELACNHLTQSKSAKIDALSSLVVRCQLRWQHSSLLPSSWNAWRNAVLHSGVERAQQVLRARYEGLQHVKKDKLVVFMVRGCRFQLLQAYFCGWQRASQQNLRDHLTRTTVKWEENLRDHSSRATLKLDRLSIRFLHCRHLQELSCCFHHWQNLSMRSAREATQILQRRCKNGMLSLGTCWATAYDSVLLRRVLNTWHMRCFMQSQKVGALLQQQRCEQTPIICLVLKLWRVMLVATRDRRQSRLDIVTQQQQLRRQGESRAHFLVRGHAALAKQRKIGEERAAWFSKQSYCNLLYVCMTVWHLEKFLHAAELRQALAKQECGKDLQLLKAVSRRPGDSTAEEMSKQFAELSDWQACLFLVMVWRIHVFTEFKERSLERILQHCQTELDSLIVEDQLERWGHVAAELSMRFHDLHFDELKTYCFACWAGSIRTIVREDEVQDVRAAIAEVNSRWLEIVLRDLKTTCLYIWRVYTNFGKLLREERRSWEEHVTSIYRDGETGRLDREEQEQEMLRFIFAKLQMGAANVILMWSRAAVQNHLAETLRMWHKHCQVQRASQRGQAYIKQGRESSLVLLDKVLDSCNRFTVDTIWAFWRLFALQTKNEERERTCWEEYVVSLHTDQELAHQESLHHDEGSSQKHAALGLSRSSKNKIKSDSSQCFSATAITVPLEGPGNIIEVPHPDDPKRLVSIKVPTSAQVGQTLLVPLAGLHSNSVDLHSASRSQDDDLLVSKSASARNSTERQRSCCAEVVEFAARNCQRRFDEELVLHCTSMWHLQATMTATLLKAEKDVQRQCDEQLERLQQQHMCGMEDLRRKCEEIAASAGKEGINNLSSPSLVEEDDAWIAAMQSLVNDLQQENEALHRAVKAQKYAG